MLTTTEAHAYMGFMLTSISRFQRGLLFLTDGQIINARMGICQLPADNKQGNHEYGYGYPENVFVLGHCSFPAFRSCLMDSWISWASIHARLSASATARAYDPSGRVIVAQRVECVIPAL